MIKFYRTECANGLLANFYPERIKLINSYRKISAEHLYQGAKFVDQRHVMMMVLGGRTPQASKDIAKTFRDNRFRNWHAIRVMVMTCVIDIRISADPLFANFLQRTGRETIIEWTPRDPFWGQHLDGGLNQMGEVLMAARARLRSRLPPRVNTGKRRELTIQDRLYLQRVASWLLNTVEMNR